MSAALAETPRPAVTGYVEALTATAALGWVWTPGSAAPLTVALRLGPETLAEAVADGLRDDLARSGIGDGRHAFTLPVPQSARPRLAELRVFALTPGGAAVPLGSPPAEDGVSERLAQLQRGLEMLVGSQRVLHRNLQSVLLSKAEATPGPDLAAVQASLQDGITTLELFVIRLEDKLARLATPPAAPARPRWALGGVALLAVSALATSVWALVRAMPG